MTTASIDADIVAYRCAASAENEDVMVALSRVDDLMGRILHELGTERYSAYLTGSNNFRYKVYPQYKAHRTDKPKPKWLGLCQEHLVTEWKARVSDGCEADDLMAIDMTNDADTIICTIDKDLLQVPGEHYNFVTQTRQTISPKEGLFRFYWQFIMGDKADNIFGYDGKARDKIPQFLYPLFDDMKEQDKEIDLFNTVRNMYDDDERMLINGACLWMQRHAEDDWLEKGRNLMEESGPKEDSIPL